MKLKMLCVVFAFIVPIAAFCFTDIAGEYVAIAMVSEGELTIPQPPYSVLVTIRQTHGIYEITVENETVYAPLSQDDRYNLPEFAAILEVYPIKNHLIFYMPEVDNTVPNYLPGLPPWRYWILRKK